MIDERYIEYPWLFEDPNAEELIPRDYNEVNSILTNKIIKNKYSQMCNQVIFRLRRMKTKNTLYGELGGNLYKDFAYRVNNGEDCEFVDFGIIANEVEAVCYKIVKALPEDDLHFLWIHSNRFFEYSYNEYEYLFDDNPIEDVVAELTERFIIMLKMIRLF